MIDQFISAMPIVAAVILAPFAVAVTVRVFLLHRQQPSPESRFILRLCLLACALEVHAMVCGPGILGMISSSVLVAAYIALVVGWRRLDGKGKRL